MLKESLAIIALLLLTLQPALSHDAWLQESDGSLAVMFGHGKSDPYDPKQVNDGKAFDCNGTLVPIQTVRHEARVTLSPKQNAATVTVLFAGTVVKTTEGYKKVTKKEAEAKYKIVEALKYRKYSKALLVPCDTFSKPVGLPMEIVPAKDPFAIKPGEPLPIQVLLDGKPLEGAVIATGDSGHSKSEAKPTTDKDGKAVVTISKPGFQLIVASFKSPLKDDPEADVLSTCSSLTFSLK